MGDGGDVGRVREVEIAVPTKRRREGSIEERKVVDVVRRREARENGGDVDEVGGRRRWVGGVREGGRAGRGGEGVGGCEIKVGESSAAECKWIDDGSESVPRCERIGESQSFVFFS